VPRRIGVLIIFNKLVLERIGVLIFIKLVHERIGFLIVWNKLVPERISVIICDRWVDIKMKNYNL
jgi:hypothetical protein